MSEPVISQKAPYAINVKPGTYFWCACGKSSKQPYCDGSHRGTEFTPVKTEITEEKQVWWCGCKHSKNKPFCDGNHKNL